MPKGMPEAYIPIFPNTPFKDFSFMLWFFHLIAPLEYCRLQ